MGGTEGSHVGEEEVGTWVPTFHVSFWILLTPGCLQSSTSSWLWVSPSFTSGMGWISTVTTLSTPSSALPPPVATCLGLHPSNASASRVSEVRSFSSETNCHRLRQISVPTCDHLSQGDLWTFSPGRGVVGEVTGPSSESPPQSTPLPPNPSHLYAILL